MCHKHTFARVHLQAVFMILCRTTWYCRDSMCTPEQKKGPSDCPLLRMLAQKVCSIPYSHANSLMQVTGRHTSCLWRRPHTTPYTQIPSSQSRLECNSRGHKLLLFLLPRTEHTHPEHATSRFLLSASNSYIAICQSVHTLVLSTTHTKTQQKT